LSDRSATGRTLLVDDRRAQVGVVSGVSDDRLLHRGLERQDPGSRRERGAADRRASACMRAERIVTEAAMA